MVFVTLTWGGDEKGMCWSSLTVSSTQHQRLSHCKGQGGADETLEVKPLYSSSLWLHQRRLKALLENFLLHVHCLDPTAANPRQAWKTLPTSLLKTGTLNKGNTISQDKDLPPGSVDNWNQGWENESTRQDTTIKEQLLCEALNFFYTFPYHLTCA